MRHALIFISWFAAAGFVSAQEPPPIPGKVTSPGQEATAIIQLHVGIPELVYLGQPMGELLRTFPDAQVNQLFNQSDAVQIKLPHFGISCLAMGPTRESLKVGSIGFNLGGTYQGVAQGSYKTDKGISIGSSVNELVEAYGRPYRISGERVARRGVPLDGGEMDPNAPQKYWYRNEDETVTTYFEIQRNIVVRVVINLLASIEEHIIKHHSE